MKATILFSLLISSAFSFAETNEDKTCSQAVEVEAVCAGYADQHPIDPLFDPAFVYLSPKSYHQVKKLGLIPSKVKDPMKACGELPGYSIYELFGDDRIPGNEIDYAVAEVEFVKDCE